ncbi:MAG TPA: hypothetical protein EYP06_00540 [Desulfobacterales bacterium]|nr:hypothetical protein [Desulfobacterales bacterium]
MKTGVFFHQVFKGKRWLIIGDKFRHFPEVMKDQLELPGVELITPPKATSQQLLKVHTPGFVDRLMRAWYCEGALYSVGGTIEAVDKVLSGELDNALVFTVAAGHHAERDSAWGGTYASCAGPAFYCAVEKFGAKRLAILDTDRHHGNGTRDIFKGDDRVLHVCFCHQDMIEDSGLKVCVDMAYPQTDQSYLAKVREEFVPRVREFQPDLIFHQLGHDTCQLDYGDLGLTEGFYLELVEEIKKLASEICQGRYVILTHGGHRADVAEQIFPLIVEILHR